MATPLRPMYIPEGYWSFKAETSHIGYLDHLIIPYSYMEALGVVPRFRPVKVFPEGSGTSVAKVVPRAATRRL